MNTQNLKTYAPKTRTQFIEAVKKRAAQFGIYENRIEDVLIEGCYENGAAIIERTGKGIVDASEMVYKTAMSKPSRFVGRTLVKGLKKLDRKIIRRAI